MQCSRLFIGVCEVPDCQEQSVKVNALIMSWPSWSGRRPDDSASLYSESRLQSYEEKTEPPSDSGNIFQLHAKYGVKEKQRILLKGLKANECPYLANSRADSSKSLIMAFRLATSR